MESAASRDESAADHEGLAELDEQLTAAVARVYRRMRSQRTPGQLGEGAMAVLAHLYRFGPKSLGALSDTERVTPASMSQTVNRLVERHLAWTDVEVEAKAKNLASNDLAEHVRSAELQPA